MSHAQSFRADLWACVQTHVRMSVEDLVHNVSKQTMTHKPRPGRVAAKKKLEHKNTD